MLSVYCGNNTIEAREQAFKKVSEIEATGVRVHRIEADEYMAGLLADALGATSLFGEQELYVFDTPSQNSEFAEAVKENLAELAESTNQFIVIEGALLAADKKPYQKHAQVFEEFKGAASERFNVFSLTDALARRDKKSLWLLFTQAKRNAISDEEIMGVLWWQLKSMWLASITSSPSEAGMKDYPYKKAKQALSKFKNNEVKELAHSLLLVYHEGHAGVRDTSLSLERWLLTF